MNYKTAFIIYVIIGVMLTSTTQIIGYGAQQAGLMMAAFVLRLLFMVFQERIEKEEYLMFGFVLIALSFGASLMTFDAPWYVITLNVLMVLLGYVAAASVGRLKARQG
ncbi:hypothetical protein [Alteromonas macleodii]|uniref:Membrane protein n=1 Tax=Alteromonas macleodii TaxID=28108 RepID=A0AB36FRP9_ALTMA|nr:hypothetical protein [Alteromonas macleodii]OES24200.1 putative membrane protein [Alteromonas macleodii]OES24832.1 putative membrane protein [Alteromonas macleodii]OES25110.1 putative membrane protein [Alteromonas macleodii]OES39153.1 putative membrane protein [Alteromonas macleodii]